MSWYLKTIFSGSVEEYLQSLGASPDIVQFIVSQGASSQILVNEFRKNPSLTIEQLQSFSSPEQEKIDPHAERDQISANPYPEPMKQWILVNLRKLRAKREWPQTTDSERVQINNFEYKFILYLPQIQDWLKRSTPKPDISSYSTEQAIKACDEWHEMIAKQGEGMTYGKTIPDLVVYGPQWKNPEWQGWTVQKVMSENDLEVEGNRMNHCVGSYCNDVSNDYSSIFSLRDPQNNPHITLETEGSASSYNPGTIKQIQGKSNSVPKDIYKAMIKEWISTSGDQAGINREVNTFEQMEENADYDGVSTLSMMRGIEQILQGEENEYGLKNIFDSDLTTVIDGMVETGEGEQSGYYNRESPYGGDVADAPPYIANLALMEDLKLPSWPKHSGEWEHLRNMPKETEWKNINEVEKWAWETIDNIQEDFYSYETGLEYPQEEDYEDPKEYEEAMEEHNNTEAEIHDEWLGQSVKGGFAKDLLSELKSLRENGIIPSAEELYETKKKKQEQELVNSPAYQNAYDKARSVAEQAVASGGNWYKKAQGINLQFLSYDSYENFKVLLNGEPRTFYDVSPHWAKKIKWMIEKSDMPGEVIYNNHLKNFSDPEKHKKLNPVTEETPKKPQQGVFPFMESSWYGKLLYATIWDTDGDGSFEDNLKAMAELEYKLQALNNWPFSGMPKRQQNIAKKLEEELLGVLEELKPPLMATFSSWLSAHALTDPATWADQRMDPYGTGAYDYIESVGASAALGGTIHEYLRYKHNNQSYNENPDQGFSEMLSQALQQPDNFPSLKGLSNLYSQDQEEMYNNELYDSGFETFGEDNTGEAFESEEAAEAWIEEQIKNFDLSDHMYDMGIENFTTSLQYAGISLEQFMNELNQHIVFPLWMNYWGAMGIEGTRELAQEAYERLENASSFQEDIVAINHAIDVHHQNGAMIEHMETYSGLEDVSTSSIQDMMDSIAADAYVPEWNQELQQIGISVPKMTAPASV